MLKKIHEPTGDILHLSRLAVIRYWLRSLLRVLLPLQVLWLDSCDGKASQDTDCSGLAIGSQLSE